MSSSVAAKDDDSSQPSGQTVHRRRLFLVISRVIGVVLILLAILALTDLHELPSLEDEESVRTKEDTPTDVVVVVVVVDDQGNNNGAGTEMVDNTTISFHSKGSNDSIQEEGSDGVKVLTAGDAIANDTDSNNVNDWTSATADSSSAYEGFPTTDGGEEVDAAQVGTAGNTTNTSGNNNTSASEEDTITDETMMFAFHGSDKEYEVPFVVYDNLQYRRVCAPVGKSSVVCMTIRYSWEVALQDPNYSYPRPVDDRFYSLNKNGSTKGVMTVVDGTALEECQQQQTGGNLTNIDEAVKYCLDKVAADTSRSVVVIFFRHQQQQQKQSISLFGTGSGQQLENALTFFDGQVVEVFGDSTAPGVTIALRNLFGSTCEFSPVGRKCCSSYCGGRKETNNDAPRRLGWTEMDGWTDMDESYNIYLGVQGYSPGGGLDIVAWMKNQGMVRNPGWKKLRELSLVIQYPMAHVQNEDMLLNKWDDVVYIQTNFPRLIMAVQTTEGRAALAELGWDLKHLIVYDGRPQFFPTSTSAYFGDKISNKEEDFVAQGGYPAKGNAPGWSPDYGHSCRGPVTTNSILRKASRISRKAFEELGLDMRFYIRNWEFTNQFWWSMSMWSGKNGALDCTHGEQGLSSMHRYLLQATMDDYYDNLSS